MTGSVPESNWMVVPIGVCPRANRGLSPDDSDLNTRESWGLSPDDAGSVPG